jgi:Ca2+-transporting ATPase
MNFYLFLSIVFLFTFLIGNLFEKVKIPWIFSSLFLGVILSFFNPFVGNTSSPEFSLLANLGMYFLLFVIGFEINLLKIKGQGKFIFKTSFWTILLNALLVGFLIKIIFASTWFIALVIGLSFSTVGEAILLPILEEFNLVTTRLGQTIIGTGTLDDIVEIFTLILVISLLGVSEAKHFEVMFIIISLLSLFGLAFSLSQLRKQGNVFKMFGIEKIFLFSIFVLFLFLGIGEFSEASSLGAILAGVGLKTFLPEERLLNIEKEVKAVCYGLFAPLFFLSAGLSMDINFLQEYFPLILIMVLVSSFAKYLGSFIAARRELGGKQSILLGTGLLVRFSTSIVIVNILLNKGMISEELYSIIMATSIIFTIITPLIFSRLTYLWKDSIIK